MYKVFPRKEITNGWEREEEGNNYMRQEYPGWKWRSIQEKFR